MLIVHKIHNIMNMLWQHFERIKLKIIIKLANEETIKTYGHLLTLVHHLYWMIVMQQYFRNWVESDSCLIEFFCGLMSELDKHLRSISLLTNNNNKHLLRWVSEICLYCFVLPAWYWMSVVFVFIFGCFVILFYCKQNG